MYRRRLFFVPEVVAGVVLCVACIPALANPIPPYISGSSTATKITEPRDLYGWYRCDVNVVWDLNHQGAGMSYWDLFVLRQYHTRIRDIRVRPCRQGWDNRRYVWGSDGCVSLLYDHPRTRLRDVVPGRFQLADPPTRSKALIGLGRCGGAGWR